MSDIQRGDERRETADRSYDGDLVPEPESQMDDNNVICPYCLNYYQAEAENYSDREREETCEICGKVYLLSDDFTVTHYTRPNKHHE